MKPPPILRHGMCQVMQPVQHVRSSKKSYLHSRSCGICKKYVKMIHGLASAITTPPFSLHRAAAYLRAWVDGSATKNEPLLCSGASSIECNPGVAPS